MNMEKCPDILKKITADKKCELKEYKFSIADFKARIADTAPPLNFIEALNKPQMSVIAEIKKASPSAGIISEKFNPIQIARQYNTAGADAVSILTDKNYFKGDIKYIEQLREIIKVPILRKDFIITDEQIYEARAYGADTFLLIAAILTVSEMKHFLELGRSLGMEPLVESHNEFELEKSINAGSRIYGINNRNLHTFEVNFKTSETLYKMIPENAVSVAESGIKIAKQVECLHKTGFSAILVGETLMRAGINKCGDIIRDFQNA